MVHVYLLSMERKIDLRASQIWIFENDIIWQENKIVSELTIEDAQQITAAVNELAEFIPNRKKLILSSMIGLMNINSNVREYFANSPSIYEWKIALVYNSSIAHMVTLLMLKLMSSRFETKSFTNYKIAIEWLRNNNT